MKTAKKFAALLLALLMMLTLCACGGKKNELLGTWTGEMDMASTLIETVDAGLGVEMPEYQLQSFGDYLGKLPLRVTLELKEDGTYLQYMDEASVEEAKQRVFDSTMQFYYDIFPVVINAELQKSGLDVDVSTVEKLEEVLGMDFDELIEQTLGMDMESYVHSVLAEDSFDSLLEKEEGKYKVEEGKLFLSSGLDYDVDPESYHPYTLKDGVLTLEVNTTIEDEAEKKIYPITLHLEK